MQKIIGYLKLIVYESENGYRICKFELINDNKHLIFIKGLLGRMEPNELYELTGSFLSSKYGSTFNVSEIKLLEPKEQNQLIKYFSSKLFPTIGEKTAKDIVNYYKTDVIQKIKADFNSLNNISSLKPNQINVIKNVFEHAQLEDELFLFFNEHYLNQELLANLKMKHSTNELVKIFKTNPYVFIKLNKVSFKDLDKIYLSFNPDGVNSDIRIAYYSQQIIKTYCFNTGNTFISLDELIERLKNKFNGLTKNLLLDSFELSKKIHLLKFINKKIYDYEIYDAEKRVAIFINNFDFEDNKINQNDIKDTQINELIFKIENNINIKYNNEQIDVLKSVLLNNLTIVAGGPGTGKTTVVKGVINILKFNGYVDNDILLMSPTGKAAKRLGDKTGIRATTIHKALKWDPNQNKFLINEEDPLDGKILIIDEMSMVDILLFNAIVKSGINLEKLILIGDTNQLPAINCGDVLRDIIKSKTKNVIKLKKIHRQKSGNDILDISYAIANNKFSGKMLQDKKDVMFYSADDSNVLYSNLKEVLSNIITCFDLLDWQLITPIYNGPEGINVLNKWLQDYINPISNLNENTKILNFGVNQYRVNDKVMQLKNRPELDVYNGDVGIIIDIKTDKEFKKHIFVKYDQKIVDYKTEMLYDLTLAYACSVHKLQGSEYNLIIFLVFNSFSFILNQKLIYTGFTRAKNKLIIIGQLNILEKGALKKLPERLTSLSECF